MMQSFQTDKLNLKYFHMYIFLNIRSKLKNSCYIQGLNLIIEDVQANNDFLQQYFFIYVKVVCTNRLTKENN